ncbi:MAG TPA: hypothetical protein VMT24_06665 [Aggregatilineaceae bacterium]|nr:hypothetical protein [Aggregatilineaceae bacterium]
MNQTLIATLDRARRIALIAGIIGLGLCVIGLFVDSAQAIQSYLFAYLFWAGTGLGCLGVLMIQFTVKGAWGLAIRRLLEAGAMTIPLLAALFIPVLIWAPVLYPWARPEVVAIDALLQQKGAYLNVPFFVIRTIGYFVVWSFLAYALRRLSRRQDTESDPGLFQRLQNLSVFGVVAFSVTVTFAMIDWIMSLEPGWSSTLYGAMVAIGGLLAAFALVVALLTRLRAYEPLAGLVTPGVLNDLGNLMLVGLLLWAYLSFSQYLIIWTGNLSDEIPWYLRRLDGGWQFVALALVVLHFAVPFVLLLASQVKRRAGTLGAVAVLLFAMHLVDSFWLVIPALRQSGLAVAWTDFAAPVGIGGLWLAAFLWQLKQSPLLPRYEAVDAAHDKEAAANG